MAERRMAEIMGQRAGFREILVKAQRPRQRARDLGHFEGVGQAGAIVVALMIGEYLRLVGKAAECGGMDDPVAIYWLDKGLQRAVLRAVALVGHRPGKRTRTRLVRRQTPCRVSP